MAKFELEHRYIVLKLSKLTDEQIEAINNIVTDPDAFTETVVIQKDWEIYPKVVELLSKKVEEKSHTPERQVTIDGRLYKVLNPSERIKEGDLHLYPVRNFSSSRKRTPIVCSSIELLQQDVTNHKQDIRRSIAISDRAGKHPYRIYLRKV